MIKIFNANDRDFSTAGNIIIEPIKCIEYKKKSLNGWYIEVEIPIKYKEYISKDKLCVVKTKSKLNPQAFRIGEDIECSTRKIKFQADHVMFDAKDYVLLDVRPTKQNGLNALNYINERTDNLSPFSIYSNVENVNTAYFIRKNLLEAWTTIEEKWGGVFDADNWNISFLTSVGNDNGETIAYGKNMQGFDIYEDWSSVCTKLLPVGYDGLLLPEKYLKSDVQYEKPYTRVVDFQTNLETEEQTEEKLLEELRQNAEAYLEENKVPKVSYTIISNVNQTLEIGDTIKVLHPFVNLFTEVLEYEYDIILEKVKSLTFGNYNRDVKTKFDNIKNSITQINQALSKQEIAINTQTNLINMLNKNGYVYIDDNEILILDTLPKEKAKNVWRFGLGGIGFSSNGYEGPFETAITMDGKINADFITTGTMAVDRIESLANFINSTNSSISKIELEQGKITSKVSSVEQSVENITKIEGTAEGKNIYIDDASTEPLIDIMLEGESQQATRSGKNFLENTGVSNTSNGVTFTINDDKTILVDGNNDGTANSRFIINNYSLKAGTYILNGCPSGGSSTTYRLAIQKTSDWSILGLDTGSGSEQFTIDEATKIQVAIFIQKGQTISNLLFKPMIRLSSIIDDTYEQYGASPSPDYPSEIESVKGKNLFDENKSEWGKYNVWQHNTGDYANAFVNVINIKGLDKCSISFKNNTRTFRFGYQFIDDNENYLSGLYWSAPTNEKIVANISVPENASKIIISQLDGQKEDDIKIQLEKGTVATPYVPYNSLEFKVEGKNKFDCANSKIIYNNGNTLYERLTNGLKIISSGGRYNMLYFLVDTVENLKGKTLTLSSDILFSKENQLTTFGLFYTDKNGGNRTTLINNNNITSKGKYQVAGQVSEGENRYYVCIGLRPNIASNYASGDYTIYDNLQIEYGETPTDYEPYKSQVAYFPLSEGQKLMEGSYLADDGIHHNFKEGLANGTSTTFEDAKENGKFYCNKKASGNLEGKTIAFDTEVTDAIVQYELAEEEIVPYTETQQEAWEKLRHFTLFKGINNITSTANAKITYVRDNGLSDTYETKRNVKENYYTKIETDSQISQAADSIKESVKEINEQTQEKLATLELANQSLEFATKRTGGNNLIRNSAMINNNNFWLAHAKYPYVESSTPPDPVDGMYWYCTENNGAYQKNQMYLYTNNEWQASVISKKALLSTQNYMANTTSNEYWADGTRANESTLSGRVIKLNGKEDYTVSHIYNITEPIILNKNEDKIAISYLVKNNIIQGSVGIGLMFLDFMDLTTIEKPYSIYEPGILLTPDDLKDLTKIENIINIPKKSDFIPVVVSNTAPTDTTKTWLDTSIYLPKVYNADTSQWELLDTRMSLYNEETREIWTYRYFYGFYYQTPVSFDTLEIKSCYVALTFYPAFAVYTGDTEPIPYKGLYWNNQTTNLVKRAKYNNTDFVEWETLDIPSSMLPSGASLGVPMFDYIVPIKGFFEIADLKLEYNTMCTQWTQFPGEVYGKNYKMDEKGFWIQANQNTMFIDEDEILATYKGINIFQINKDLAYFYKIQATESIEIGNYFLKTQQINSKNMLLLY